MFCVESAAFFSSVVAIECAVVYNDIIGVVYSYCAAASHFFGSLAVREMTIFES